jgi:hypothetical protein
MTLYFEQLIVPQVYTHTRTQQTPYYAPTPRGFTLNSHLGLSEISELTILKPEMLSLLN